AAAAARIFAADGGPGLVDGAAALVGVEEAADLAEMHIGLAAHGIGLVAVHLGEFAARGLEAQPEVIGQPLHITLLERDQGIGAAIARTLRTVIGRHDLPASNHATDPTTSTNARIHHAGPEPWRRHDAPTGRE